MTGTAFTVSGGNLSGAGTLVLDAASPLALSNNTLVISCVATNPSQATFGVFQISGLQIVAGHYRDALVLRAAARFAETTPLKFPVLPETHR